MGVTCPDLPRKAGDGESRTCQSVWGKVDSATTLMRLRAWGVWEDQMFHIWERDCLNKATKRPLCSDMKEMNWVYLTSKDRRYNGAEAHGQRGQGWSRDFADSGVGEESSQWSEHRFEAPFHRLIHFLKPPPKPPFQKQHLPPTRRNTPPVDR